MNRSDFTLILVFVGSVVLLLSVSLPSVATSLSGRVIDEEGQPVSGITVALLPQSSETDEIGAFSITGISTSSVSKLMLLPIHEINYEIRAVEVEGVTFYLDPAYRFLYKGSFPIAIEPEADVKDVVIIVRLRMRIRGRVLSTDGTPLRNARVYFEIKWHGADNKRRGSSEGSRTLDADGYFVKYAEEPAYYTITVGYQGQFAESKSILLEEGQQLDGLVLTLRDDPNKQLPSKAVVKPVLKPVVLAAVKPPVKPKIVIPPRAWNPQSAEAARQREREGMWVINPDNRHAYKIIYCKTREEAEAKAIAQGAHLVTINDAAEQRWLFEVFGKEKLRNDENEQGWDFKAFGRESFWIGLTGSTRENSLHWANGEPVTYTNWEFSQKAVEGDEQRENDEPNQHYTVLIGRTGKWQMVRQWSRLANLIEKAILEKENFIAGTSE
jgi:hypothetical protein